jgi:hypothetical protein
LFVIDKEGNTMPTTVQGKRAPGTSLRLPVAIDQLWDDVAERIGQNKTATFIEAIRLLAKHEGVSMRSVDTEEAAA